MTDEKKPGEEERDKKAEGQLEEEQLDDAAGGIETVPLPEVAGSAKKKKKTPRLDGLK